MEHTGPFAHSLETAIALATRLEQALFDETRAIELRDPDELQHVVAGKQQLADQLEEETLRMKQWVEEAGHTFNAQGVERLLEHVDPQRTLTERWDALRDFIVRCDQLNRTNAALINRDRKRVTLSLRILRGEDPNATTYDPRGQADNGTPHSRTISRA
ncbi:flagella synthesis protein FlgN [Marichromatium bheemlicum]|uniref:Flagellar protein FlgN n=1 Tax=Marichromatium bheemlicum TaxID=365339 RepID=A0ABX1I8B7_9GAMM|nr:flagellar protein FlgN [Marichromatium bheemlicum]NKN33184.1 flagellar protein FlgN [Marichromatium bheemlicum]